MNEYGARNSAGKKISVMTLNLRFGLAQDGKNSWEYRKSIFPELLNRYKVDFLALQEVNNFQSDFISKILSQHRVIGIRKPAPVFWQNNVIFYHHSWECRFCDHFFLSSTPDIPSRLPESIWPRQCTMGLFEKLNQRMICINTHFDFGREVQLHSAKLIMERLSQQPVEIPAILMGDFNADPSCQCYKIFTGTNKHQRNQSAGYFKPVFDEPYPGTHHGFTGETDGDHIDWILFRGNLMVQACKVIRDKFAGRYPSDHFPLFAVFC
jgi:endonuclease/exonuclease/phosphatase family metal-dependent hydrolase